MNKAVTLALFSKFPQFFYSPANDCSYLQTVLRGVGGLLKTNFICLCSKVVTQYTNMKFTPTT